MTDTTNFEKEIHWIGSLPHHWRVSKLKNIALIFGGGTPKDDVIHWDGSINWATPGDFSDGDFLKSTKRTITKEGLKYSGQMMLAGDLLVSSRAPVGKVCRVIKPTSFNQGCKGIRPIKQNNNFLFYTLQAASLEMQSVSTGTTFQEINSGALGSIMMPTPPLPEQQAIATFLDHHVDLIDRERNLIAQKIDLLREKRKALIFEVATGKRTIVETQALAGDADRFADVITYGQWSAVPTPNSDDPFVGSERLVDSGVEWIGDTPEGWTISKLKNFVSIFGGGTPKDDPINWGGPVNWATPGDFNDGEILNQTKRTITEKGLKSSGELMSPGDILISSRAPVGKVCRVSEQTSFNQGCKGIRTNQQNELFMFYALQAASIEMQSVSTGTTFQEINSSALSSLMMVFPPLGEQSNIALFLDLATTIIGREINLLQRKIDLLADKRKALIFEAVTGKIDLRPNN